MNENRDLRSSNIGVVTISIQISRRSTDVAPINTPKDSTASDFICRWLCQMRATSWHTDTRRPYPSKQYTLSRTTEVAIVTVER